MTVVPDEGIHVYAALFDRAARVSGRVGDWFLLDFGDGEAALGAGDLVVPSSHAMMRWRTRMWAPGEGEPHESEEIARRWGAGERVPGGHGLHGEEVRLDEETGAVFVRKENAVATVIAPDRRKPELDRAVRAMGAEA